MKPEKVQNLDALDKFPFAIKNEVVAVMIKLETKSEVAKPKMRACRNFLLLLLMQYGMMIVNAPMMDAKQMQRSTIS